MTKKTLSPSERVIEHYKRIYDKPRCSLCFTVEDSANGIEVKEHNLGHICTVCDDNDNVSMDKGDTPKAKASAPRKSLTPEDAIEIQSNIEKYLIGQKETTKVLTYCLYKQNKNLTQNNKSIPQTLFLIGPSGVGKTETVRILKREYQKDVITINSASITDEGYIGNSLNDVLGDMLSIHKLENFDNSIIYFDEFDKLCNNKEVGGKGVQHQLLRILEGEKEFIYMDKKGYSKEVSFNNSIIIFSGAFSTLVDKKTSHNGGSVGFVLEKKDKEKELKISNDELTKYGLQRELLNRINNIVFMQPLSVENIINILKSNDIEYFKHIQNECESEKINFIPPEDETMKLMAELCVENKSYIRGVNLMINKAMKDYIFEIANKEANQLTFVIEEKELKLKLM